MSIILDQFGDPATTELAPQAPMSMLSPKEAVAFFKAASNIQYIQALGGLDLPSFTRSSTPLENHAWVFAACFATAINLAQAPYQTYMETEDATNTRRAQAKAMGRSWATGLPPRGLQRRAIQRYGEYAGRKFGRQCKALTPDPDNQLMTPLSRPNFITMTNSQLWFTTTMWLKYQGECFWLCLDEAGNAVPYTSDSIVEIWPLNPKLFYEIIVNNVLIGWRFSVDRSSSLGLRGGQVLLDIDQVIQFKFPVNIQYPIRGMSPLTAAAANINLDIQSVGHNRAVMANGADPGGVLVQDQPLAGSSAWGSGFKDPQEEKEFQLKWEQRHKGEGNARRIAMLSGGWKYVPIGMSPRDMDYLKSSEWNRDSILGVLGVPKSVLSITDHINYATGVAQDRNFWDKSLLPLMRYYEQTLDATLFLNRPDNEVGMFDLSKVEALRAGLAEKIDVVTTLTGTTIHMPPDQAFEMVGLEIQPYEGSDLTIVPTGFQTFEMMLTAPPPAPKGTPAPTETKPPNPAATPRMPLGDKPATPKMLTIIRGIKRSPWQQIIRTVQGPAEMKMAQSWRSFALAQRAQALAHFDNVVGTSKSAVVIVKGDINLSNVAINLGASQKALQAKMKKAYQDLGQSTYDWTVEELGGIPMFSFDDPDIQQSIEDSENILIGSAPKTIQNNLRTSISNGIQKGETVQQLRSRVAHTYDIAANGAKALSVARTESGRTMNKVRDDMFKKQGIGTTDWSTAEDEYVRDDHQTFGKAGSKPIGYNWLIEVKRDAEGVLARPGDERAPADEVINCRCVAVPGDE